jgi:hypothetical protein
MKNKPTFAPPAKPLPNVPSDQRELYSNVGRAVQSLENQGRGGLQEKVSNNRQDKYAVRGPEAH